MVCFNGTLHISATFATLDCTLEPRPKLRMAVPRNRWSYRSTKCWDALQQASDIVTRKQHLGAPLKAARNGAAQPPGFLHQCIPLCQCRCSKRVPEGKAPWTPSRSRARLCRAAARVPPAGRRPQCGRQTAAAQRFRARSPAATAAPGSSLCNPESYGCCSLDGVVAPPYIARTYFAVTQPRCLRLEVQQQRQSAWWQHTLNCESAVDD